MQIALKMQLRGGGGEGGGAGEWDGREGRLFTRLRSSGKMKAEIKAGRNLAVNGIAVSRQFRNSSQLL